MRLAFAIAAMTLLAGCASDAPAADETAVNETAVAFVQDYTLGNESIPAAELQNATLGDDHVHDAWAGAQELVLLDETIEAGDCEGPQDAAFYAMVTTFNAQGPAYGCARLSLPEGAVVPEGTGELRIEVDATGALKSGAMEIQFRNKAREERLEASSEPQHVWTIPLAEADWDIAHATSTTFVMYLGAVGPGALLQGPVLARVVAAKADGWEPVVAIAHVDHWSLPSLHEFAAPGVMRLGEGEMVVKNIDPARATGGGEIVPMPFDDIIAPGARFLTIVTDTTGDCPSAIQCWLVPELIVGGYERRRFGELLYEDGPVRAYVWAVPDEVPEDSVYANQSTTAITPRIDACLAGDAQGLSCGFAGFAADTVRAHVRVFAWKGDVDSERLKALVSS